ncbi:MAG: FAD-dependent oxidoreductase, partial [Actinomycetota bacterium]|nr:FAD-dependent oxidoreductase [Actinomycetota bacterium]
GIHLAMDYLTPSNRVQEGDLAAWPITAEGKHVVIIGGGDTGADCLGTAHRQGAASITQLEIMPEPPKTRATSTPWPGWPLLFRTSSAHEEGGDRVFSVNTQRFVGIDGAVDAIELVEVDPSFQPIAGTERLLPAQLVLLAMGFTGPQTAGLLDDLGVQIDGRGNVVRDVAWATTVPGVFVAGDMGRGQSLIVWAIAEGRAAAASVDVFLSGRTALPAPIIPTARGL